MRVKLKDVSVKITDGSHNPPQSIDSSPYVMISSKNIDDDCITLTDPRYLTAKDHERENQRTSVVENDILMTIVGTVGRVAVVSSDHSGICLQRSVAVIKPKKEIVNSRYLMYMLQSLRVHLEKEAHGVAQKGIYLKQLEETPVTLVDLPMQERIATVLDKVSDLIAMRKKQLQKLDELVKSRFVEMFGTEAELDKWPCCTIGDVADVCVGVVIKPTQYYTEDGIPAFRSLNIGEMRVKDSDWVYFTEEGHRKNQKSIIRKNDVLVVRSGAPGTACVATEKYDGYNAVDIIIAHPDNDKVNSVFLAAFTNMPHGMNQIHAKTGGAAQQHFNVGGYKAMHLIMPSLELQNQFAAFVEQTDKSKLTIQQSLDKLELMKKALMQKYFG